MVCRCREWREAPATDDSLIRGVCAVRLAVGLALIIVALQEKLPTPSMGLAFLHAHPDFNVAQSVFGPNWSDLQFMRVAGAFEVLSGLLLISGALPQACVVIAGIPFNATLWFFGTIELLGHLPVYGAMPVTRTPERRRAASVRPY